MGCWKPGFASCRTNYTISSAPDPSKWDLRKFVCFKNAYVILADYPGCTNFEGRKIMVFRGKMDPTMGERPLDPHFSESPLSPIARFMPTPEGWKQAQYFARSL